MTISRLSCLIALQWMAGIAAETTDKHASPANDVQRQLFARDLQDNTGVTNSPTRSPTSLAPTTPSPTFPAYDYYDQPQTHWVGEVSGQIRRNNAVQQSPDGKRLYVTTSNGVLHVLNPTTGAVIRAHISKPYQSGWAIESESGVEFYMDGDNSYLIYGITDVGPQGQRQSRVVALSHPRGALLWTSPPMEGEIAGTPAITAAGDRIFLTRNIEDGTVGYFTILDVVTQGTAVFDEASDRYRDQDRAPYGPVGLARNPIGINGNDLAWWAHSTDAGRADSGMTRAFQLPATFNGNGDYSELRVDRLKPVQWTTTNRPVFLSDGDDVYFTGTRSGVRAWINGADGNEKASFNIGLTRKNNDGLQPPYTAVALAPGGGSMYVGSATTTFAKISKAGTITWEVPIGSVTLGQPAVSYDNRRVYFIEAKEGTVAAHDTRTGQRLWSIGCQDYLPDENCQSSIVEGEFSLTSNGQMIYFGNRMGKVVALRVGNPPTEPPTPRPTPKPTRRGSVPRPSPSVEVETDEPTFNPVPFPTLEPSWDTYEPTPTRSSAYTKNISMFGVMVGLLVTAVSYSLILSMSM